MKQGVDAFYPLAQVSTHCCRSEPPTLSCVPTKPQVIFEVTQLDVHYHVVQTLTQSPLMIASTFILQCAQLCCVFADVLVIIAATVVGSIWLLDVPWLVVSLSSFSLRAILARILIDLFTSK